MIFLPRDSNDLVIAENSLQRMLANVRNTRVTRKICVIDKIQFFVETLDEDRTFV